MEQTIERSKAGRAASARAVRSARPAARCDGRPARTLTGPREAWFDREAERWRPRLVEAAVSFVRERNLAEDVAQEALVRAWRHIDRLGESERFGPWVIKIARNVAVDLLRRRRRRPESALPDGADPEAPTSEGSGSSRDDEEVERLRRRLWAAFAHLTGLERRMLLLRYARGLENELIAEETGRSVVAVKVAVHRGRERLKELLEGGEPVD